MKKDFIKLPLRSGVGIIVLNKSDKVFVAKRIDNPKNFWQMPQGGVDDDEDFLKAAYRELYEETSIKNVELIRVNTIEESHKLFREKKVDVLAGLKPKLIEEIETNDEFEMITIPFTFIKQSIGIKKGNPEILDFLNNFISKLIKEGFVEGLLKKHNVQNKLSIPKIV